MKIRKNVLADALKVLGKVVSQTSPVAVLRSVRFLGIGEQIWLAVTDGVESVVLEVAGDAEGMGDFAVEYKALRELCRSTRGSEVEVAGERIDWPEMEVVPDDAEIVTLTEEFSRWLAKAAQIVEREEPRLPLRGINLSSDGITAANGKQLVHIPVAWELQQNFTLPFPLALLTAMPNEAGTLSVWQDTFQIKIGNFQWRGKSIPGHFPDWKQVVPQSNALDYAITLQDPEKVISFLKTVPDKPPFHGIELNVMSEGVAVVPHDFPEMVLPAIAEFTGVRPRAVLALNKHTLLRMLQQGYTTFRAYSDGQLPIIAEGGCGRFVTMPLRIQAPTQQSITPKEEPKVEAVKPIEVTEPVNVMDELNAAIDDMRGKLKMLFDESATLTRKVKEAVLQQKQKEREFIMARKAIERIKMAI